LTEVNIDMKAKHPIRAVTRQTGLSPHLIRVWERRYQAVVPKRTGTNRRLYSDEDIHRLILLRQATEAGESISQIASLSTKELEELVGNSNNGSDRPAVRPDSEPRKVKKSVEHYFKAAIEAIRLLEPARLEGILEEASLELGRPVILEDLLEPLMYTIGDMWNDGDIKVVHEHMASAVVRSFLGNMNTIRKHDGSPPRIIITTPPGQWHEFGALMISISAIFDGWNAIYLGPNIPVDQIATASRLENTRAVALSIVYPSDDPRVDAELKRLRHLVGEDMTILIGGRAACGYAQTIKEIGAVKVDSLSAFRKNLATLRSGGH